MKKHILSIACISLVLCAQATEIRGTVNGAGRPLGGVIVTDGYGFARTGADGRFEMELSDSAVFVSVVTPSGYMPATEEGTPQFYLPADRKTKSYDFELNAFPSDYTLLAIGDPQPKTKKHFERLQKEITPELQSAVARLEASGEAVAAIVLGDIVWDSPELFGDVRSELGRIGVPVWPVIGNHDHDLKVSDDFGATKNYRDTFGPTYYAFDMGDTHYIVLDDIIYHGAKKYDEGIDGRQMAWVTEYAKMLPAGSRVCVAMHAPMMKYFRNNLMLKGGDRLMDILSPFELHILTGHTHVNSNIDVRKGVVEHNVAQICGNLWHDPMNNDGTPRGYQIFRERGGDFNWSYRTLGQPSDYQMRIWDRGEVDGCENDIVVKIWNWDSYWSVVWYEDGIYRGTMQRISLADPDYAEYLERLKADGRKLASPQKSRLAPFYFTARPSASAEVIEVVATDRFGRRYSQKLYPKTNL